MKAFAPIANQEDSFGLIYCDGGALQLQTAMHFAWIGGRTCPSEGWDRVDRQRLYRRLPLISALDDITDRVIYRDFIRHPTFDEYWKSYSLKPRYGDVDVPALFISGWYDNFIHEVIKTFRGWREEARSEETRRQTKLLVGPWPHMLVGSDTPFGCVNFGAGSGIDLVDTQLRWFDRRLRGIEKGVDDEPAVRLFVIGENVWRDEHDWPLARTQRARFYLHSQGGANSLFGNDLLSNRLPADEPPDGYVYDPADPVPTLGGQSLLLEDAGPRDRRPVERLARVHERAARCGPGGDGAARTRAVRRIDRG